MPTLKDIQLKISGVKKTQQITKAMNMVATSRLRGAQQNMDAFRPYAGKFAEVLGSLAERAGEESNPLLVPKSEVKNIHLVLCTSDRGLCGGFNANLIDLAETFVDERGGEDRTISITAFGKKGRDWARKLDAVDLAEEYIGVVGGKIGFNVASSSGRKLTDAFLEGVYDEVYIIYSRFLTMAKQLPVLQQLLPIPAIQTDDDGADGDGDQDSGYLPEHICEPSVEELLGDLLPRSVFVQVFSALLETSTSEHAARMMAMDNATKACKDILKRLTLTYNKARQAAVTAELMDIVGGAEALKG
ncbi:MAG: ATP synthase F1 subunit gamma [Desulfobacterales bacterium]|jgi:F-type H+-transporting ATPase subunit gamma